MRAVREECLSKVIPIGQGMLWRVLREYGAHFHHERIDAGAMTTAFDSPQNTEALTRAILGHKGVGDPGAWTVSEPNP